MSSDTKGVDANDLRMMSRIEADRGLGTNDGTLLRVFLRLCDVEMNMVGERI